MSWMSDAEMSANSKPVVPLLGIRDDGAAMLYPGSDHTFTGSSEAAKSWAALEICRQEIRVGHHVMYFDFENGPNAMRDRLREYGLSDTEMDKYFHLRTPIAGDAAEPLTKALALRLTAQCQALGVTLVVVDAITGAMGSLGLNADRRDDVDEFMGLIGTLKEAGVAVLYLDHISKPKGKPGKYAGTGSERKLSATDGAYFTFEVIDQPQPGAVGRVEIRVNKDRHGKVRAKTVDDVFAVFVMDSTGTLISAGFREPDDIPEVEIIDIDPVGPAADMLVAELFT